MLDPILYQSSQKTSHLTQDALFSEEEMQIMDFGMHYIREYSFYSAFHNTYTCTDLMLIPV